MNVCNMNVCEYNTNEYDNTNAIWMYVIIFDTSKVYDDTNVYNTYLYDTNAYDDKNVW